MIITQKERSVIAVSRQSESGKECIIMFIVIIIAVLNGLLIIIPLIAFVSGTNDDQPSINNEYGVIIMCAME